MPRDRPPPILDGSAKTCSDMIPSTLCSLKPAQQGQLSAARELAQSEYSHSAPARLAILLPKVIRIEALLVPSRQINLVRDLWNHNAVRHMPPCFLSHNS